MAITYLHKCLKRTPCHIDTGECSFSYKIVRKAKCLLSFTQSYLYRKGWAIK